MEGCKSSATYIGNSWNCCEWRIGSFALWWEPKDHGSDSVIPQLVNATSHFAASTILRACSAVSDYTSTSRISLISHIVPMLSTHMRNDDRGCTGIQHPCYPFVSKCRDSDDDMGFTFRAISCPERNECPFNLINRRQVAYCACTVLMISFAISGLMGVCSKSRKTKSKPTFDVNLATSLFKIVMQVPNRVFPECSGKFHQQQ